MQPSEQAGITEDIIQKLQEKATVLTQERKKRGRSVPEDLLTQDSLKTFQTLASHPVNLFKKIYIPIEWKNFYFNFYEYLRVFTLPVFLVF